MSNPTTPQSSLEEKMRNLKASMNKEMQCPLCGSVWFREAQFSRYSAGRFGGAPGADMQIISNVTHTIRVCLCGYPINPNLSGEYEFRGRTLSGELSSFMNSLKMSIAKLESRKPEIIESGIAEKLGPEIDVLKQRIANIQERLEDLAKTPDNPPAESPSAESPVKEPPSKPKPATNRKSTVSTRREVSQAEKSTSSEKSDGESNEPERSES